MSPFGGVNLSYCITHAWTVNAAGYQLSVAQIQFDKQGSRAKDICWSVGLVPNPSNARWLSADLGLELMSLEASAVWDILPLQKLSAGNAHFKCLLAEYKKEILLLSVLCFSSWQTQALSSWSLQLRSPQNWKWGKREEVFFLLSHLSEEVYKLLKELTSSKCRTRFESYMAKC